MEDVIQFLQGFGYSNFKIKDTGNRVIAYIMAADVNEAISEFKKKYAGLESGKSYRIIVGKNPNFQETRSEFLDFRKNETKSFSNMDTEYWEKRLKEEYERGQKDAEIKILRNEVDSLRRDFDRFKAAVAQKFDELDGTPDGDLLTKVTEAASFVTENKDTFKDMFTGSGKF